MKTLLFYLLQVIVTSGILYGYYHFALRNKRFHRYNRFYLLAATILSITVPFLNIPVYFAQSATESSFVLETLTFISSNATDNSPVVIANHSSQTVWFTRENILLFFYMLVALIALLRIIFSVLKIRKIIRSNPVEQLDKIHFVNTDEPGTPFSFFRWLFWNKKIELQSEKGEQIFRHELFHIEQKHSWDTIYMELLTVVFWINPFFYLIRKEVKAIHEFLADQFAVSENTKWQYAELLLMQALNTNQHLVNPFFHNQIKRRIAMITTSKKSSYQYLRKMMVLPVAAIVIGLFAFSYKEKNNPESHDSLFITDHQSLEDTTKKPLSNTITWIEDFPLPPKKSPTSDQLITWADSKMYGVWLDDKRISNNDLKKYKLSDFVLYSVSKLEKNAVNYGKHFYQVNLWTNNFYDKNQQTAASNSAKYLVIKDSTKPLLGSRFEKSMIVIDGVINSAITANNLNEYISTDDLAFVNVLKGTAAVLKYGEKGKNGVIEIGTKKKQVTFPVNTFAQGQIKIDGHVTRDTVNKPLIVLDDQKQTEDDDVLKKLDPNIIESINILKGPQAILKYGELGKNGVIEIITKKVKKQDGTNNIVFDKVEIEPSFPGGALKWRQYLERNLDATAPIKRKAQDGVYTVVVQFIVDKEGNISEVKGLTNHEYGMEEEAIRIIRKGPQWIPAIQNGQPVRAYKKQAVTFILRNGGKNFPSNVASPDNEFNEVVVTGFSSTAKTDNIIFDKVETPPHFPGGDTAWRRYLQRNINPSVPVDSGAPAGTYKVIVQFIVHENGQLSDIKSTTKHGFGMEKEAIRIIEDGPGWIPAMQNGKIVRAYVQQPITFQVEEESNILSTKSQEAKTSNGSYQTPEITLSQLKNSSALQLMHLPSGTEIASFQVDIDDKKGGILLSMDYGNKFSEKTKSLFDLLKNNDIIMFSYIKTIVGGVEKKNPLQIYRIIN